MDDLSTSADKDFSLQFLESRKKRRMRNIGLLLAVVAAIGGYYVWTQQYGGQVAEDEILFATVRIGDIENAIPAAGKMQPKEVVPIGARASGELVEIYVEVGDFVAEDQVVALIDPAEQELRVESSRLSLENQENQMPQRLKDLEIAESNYNRTMALWEAKASTDQEKENAEKSLLSAQIAIRNLENSIRQSETNLEQEEVQLRYTEVKAPMAGTIISLDQKEGATLNASQTAPTIMQIADLTTLTVETEISEADIQALQTGIEVYFTTLGSGDRRWYGTLSKIDPIGRESNNVVLFTGRFDVDNADGELYPNMTTQVFFVTSHAENVPIVQLGALTFTNGSGSPAGAAEGAQMSGRQGGAGAAGGQNMAAQRGAGVNGGDFAGGRGNRGGGGGRGAAFPGGEGGFSGGGGPRGDGGQRGGGQRGGGPGGRGGGEFPGEGDQNAGPSVPRLAGSIALNDPRNATAQVRLPDGSLETRQVMVGAQDRVNAEVLSGLDIGDEVVAGIIQARLEDENDNSNNRRDDNWRGPQNRGGMFY